MCVVYNFDVCDAIKVTHSKVQLIRINCTWYIIGHSEAEITASLWNCKSLAYFEFQVYSLALLMKKIFFIRMNLNVMP